MCGNDTAAVAAVMYENSAIALCAKMPRCALVREPAACDTLMQESTEGGNRDETDFDS